MARIVKKLDPQKRVMPGRGGFGDKVKIKAFTLFTELTPELKQKFPVAEIARKIKVSRAQLHTWIKEGRWRERLDIAFDKAKAQTSNNKKLIKLIGEFAKDDDAVGLTDIMGKEMQTFEAAREKRLQSVMRTMGNVLFEVRSYNALMYRVLTGGGEQVDKIRSKLGLGLTDREKTHRAWSDSTKLLMDLFSSSNLRALAMDKVPIDLLSRNIRERILNEGDPARTNITINNSPAGGEGDGSTVAVLTDSTHELILNILTGKSNEQFPIEPPSIHPKYDRSSSPEDVQVIKPRAADEDGEKS